MQPAAPDPPTRIEHENEMAHLKRVLGGGFKLLWPDGFPEVERIRGEVGYIVDIDHPCEKGYDRPRLDRKGKQELDANGKPIVDHVLGWCEGQEGKLEDAPEGSVPDEIVCAQALGARRAWEVWSQGAPPPAPRKPSATDFHAPREPETVPPAGGPAKRKHGWKEVEG